MSKITFGESLVGVNIVSPGNNEYLKNGNLIIKVKADNATRYQNSILPQFLFIPVMQ
jgi:hypothetical protein